MSERRVNQHLRSLLSRLHCVTYECICCGWIDVTDNFTKCDLENCDEYVCNKCVDETIVEFGGVYCSDEHAEESGTT